MISPRSVLFLLLLLPFSAQAEEKYGNEIPNSFGKSLCVHCHISNSDPDKGTVTGFGNDWDANSRQWDAALAQFDSDGDGEPNGVELGDPLAEWKKGGRALFAKISNPNDASSRSDNPDRDALEGEAGMWTLVNATSSTSKWRSYSTIERIATGRNSDMVALGGGWYWATDNSYFFSGLYPHLYDANAATWDFLLVDDEGLFSYSYATGQWTWYERNAQGATSL